MFDADRPITHSSEDRLNRATFAKYLARCTLDHHDPESLVIGLYGGWGVGKTSIINLVLEELNRAATNMFDEEKPIILNFSSWSYSGQTNLVNSFFRRLSSVIRQAPNLDNANRIIYLLELYLSYFTERPAPNALKIKSSWWKPFSFKNNQSKYGWETGKDLTLVKAELNELLSKQKHKIIIFIDNISRLANHEIKQIFQIVKSMGDYSNTVYLLALDKEQAIQALNKLDEGNGKEYIEKIVQLPFTVPPILQNDLENLLANKLHPLLTTVAQDTWNTEYWADIYYTSLKYFFTSCRDVTRYINTLNFSYPRVADLVNPVDFFALTAIEVFIPEVYSGIRDNKDLFTDLLDNVYVLDQKHRQEDIVRVDEILARNTHVDAEIMLEILLRLFPRLRHLYQPSLPFYHSDILARKLKRICNPDSFDVYFRLSIQSGQILDSEWNTLLSLAHNAEMFDQALTRLNQDNRIPNLLDRLDSPELDRIAKENISPLISALLDNGDLFPIGTASMLGLDTSMRIHRIIHRSLHRFDANTRFNIMQQAIINATKSVFSLVHELQEQGREHAEKEDTFIPIEYRDLTPEQLESLRKLTVTRIQFWAEHGQLADHPRLFELLLAWYHWGNREDCRLYIKKLTDSDRGLLSFLTAVLAEPIKQTMTHYQRNHDLGHYLNTIALFIPPEQLLRHAKLLFEDQYFEKLRENEQLALMIFLDLVKADTNKVIPQTGV